MAKMEMLFSILPGGMVMDIQNRYGNLLKLTSRGPLGCQVVKNLHATLGRLLGKGAKAAHLDEGRDAVDLSTQVMKKFFGPIMTVEKEGDGEFIFSFSECPYALADEQDTELCHAVMNFELELVRALGGKLTILDRIPEGASKCRFQVTNDA
jgi:hypothetical protein